MDSEKRTALVLGATGGVGGAIAGALLARGWAVRGLARDLEAARRNGPAGVQWVGGDAMSRADVSRGAEGVSVIVHAVNPPGYKDWDRLVLPMIDNTIAAARAVGARIALPGTVYNFDPAQTPVLSEASPQNPKSVKGRIRAELEARLERAAPEVESLIVRAGDFFGPGARSSWFAQAMVAPGKPVRRIVNVARGGGHSWAYLPDLAQTFALLLERPENLRPFERVQFEGVYDASGKVMIAAVEGQVGRKLPVWRFPWWAMHLLAPFGGFAREAADIAAVWRHPMRMDNTRLVELLGQEPRTPLDTAMRQTLVAMGCLEDGPAPIGEPTMTLPL
ncbi:NAD(P)H-binding protein [Pelagibacterium halotolerans]|uniref:NAD(P)H-binding protein n=1 Tax=Pelagibacterium halotolerans TaxID=531813 RepID=UPI00089B5C11|nr:NAD(P)H-binding protein [Pelagibacterium halotolerans]QJR20370.1 NAD(P)H-binding protein [Pelagibacterium halotolerans]SEA60054.1 Nucleoside-diphosphate-sugar epimerase [Pelagibacterium halotolerans]